MPVNCYSWEHIPSCPVTLVLFLHSQNPSAQWHQTSSQRDNEVSKWVSIPSSVLGGEWCSRCEWGHFFLFTISAVFPMFLFLISSDWPQPHWDAASQPPPGLGDTTGNCGCHSECLVCPASSISGCHQGLTQVKQCSCGHQIIVRAIWHQLRLRQALPSTKRRLVRHLLTFNYNVAEILLVGLHLTKVSKMK